jgi:hypothetical protein
MTDAELLAATADYVSSRSQQTSTEGGVPDTVVGTHEGSGRSKFRLPRWLRRQRRFAPPERSRGVVTRS